MKSIFGGSAVIAAALLTSLLVLAARPSAAETILSHFQQKQETVQTPAQQPRGTSGAQPNDGSTSSSGTISAIVTEDSLPASGNNSTEIPVTQPATYVATAYSLSGRTASGKRVSRGLIAADPSVLPMGTRVRVEAGQYTGEYIVADTGGAVRGRRIDIWTPSSSEARRFGRRPVKLTVLSYGPKRSRVKQKSLR
jgi:3D (Asp-Asp-Asp) domain-containing protein